MMKVFLAAPFTGLIDPLTGRVQANFVNELNEIIMHLSSNGCQVISAHEREEWGADLDHPDTALRLDLDGIENCDLLIAVVGDPPSPGVQLEIGYALALKKPIILILHPDQFIPYLLRKPDASFNVQTIRSDDLSAINDQLLKILTKQRELS